MGHRWWRLAGMDEAVARRRLYRLGEERYRDRLMLAWARAAKASIRRHGASSRPCRARWSAPKFPLKAADFIARGMPRARCSGRCWRWPKTAGWRRIFRWRNPPCKPLPTRRSRASPVTTGCEHPSLSILAGFADISLAQLLLVAGVALLASVVGGLAGYGTGALMPLVLVPDRRRTCRSDHRDLFDLHQPQPLRRLSQISDGRRALIVISAAALTTALAPTAIRF